MGNANVRRGIRAIVALLGMLALGTGGARSNAPELGAVAAATLPNGTPRAALPAARTFASAADAALATLEHTIYRPPGRWNLCVPDDCGSAASDWGADSLTYTLFLRWKVARDASISPIMSALAATTPGYAVCRVRTCKNWSDIPLWDAIAAARAFEVTRDPAALVKARRAFSSVDRSDAFALGACPSIDYQKPSGGSSKLKTLETDSNYIKAALLLFGLTGDRRYREKAIAKYAAVRRYFLDPALALYTVYVFDDGRACAQLPHRFYASVNGNMISNGLALAKATRKAAYAAEAVATARAVVHTLSDSAGVYADLQADNDVAEPLVEAMYDLAAERNARFARDWLCANAAVAVPALSGAYGRFFGGPAPSGSVSAWSSNGGLALAVAAGALDPGGISTVPNLWEDGRFVDAPQTGAPARIAFTGRAIALIGTIGDTCCELGHVRVVIDGRETSDLTGIWQNKSPAAHALPNSVLLSWRWPVSGPHTIGLEPAEFNAKEGGSYIHLQGYEFVP